MEKRDILVNTELQRLSQEYSRCNFQKKLKSPKSGKRASRRANLNHHHLIILNQNSLSLSLSRRDVRTVHKRSNIHNNRLFFFNSFFIFCFFNLTLILQALILCFSFNKFFFCGVLYSLSLFLYYLFLYIYIFCCWLC